MKIRKGDTVKIITGKDRGRTGKVIKVFVKESKILVQGLNLFKKHKRPRKEGEKGETITVSCPLHASNAVIICSKCGKAVRLGYVFDEKKKIRICKKCKSALEN